MRREKIDIMHEEFIEKALRIGLFNALEKVLLKIVGTFGEESLEDQLLEGCFQC